MIATPYLWLGLAILLGIAGQIVLKTGTIGSSTIWTQLIAPWTIGGFGIYFASALAYIVALRRIPISLAYPSVSISYGIMAVVAHVLWNEPLNWQHAIGIVLIMGGIVVLFRA